MVGLADFDQRGGADLQFQYNNGIAVLGKTSTTSWTFGTIAQHLYGARIGNWNFGGGDRLLAMSGDADGDGRRDFRSPAPGAWGC